MIYYVLGSTTEVYVAFCNKIYSFLGVLCFKIYQILNFDFLFYDLLTKVLSICQPAF